jgi:hypothetical protein
MPKTRTTKRAAPPPAGVRVYSRAEVLAILGVDLSTLKHWVRRGTWPPPTFRGSSKKVYWLAATVDDLLAGKKGVRRA